MNLQYTVLKLLDSDMFRHDYATFREYTPSLELIKLNWITLITSIAFSTFCRNYQVYVDKMCEISIVL
jgi:hypothetical protein